MARIRNVDFSFSLKKRQYNSHSRKRNNTVTFEYEKNNSQCHEAFCVSRCQFHRKLNAKNCCCGLKPYDTSFMKTCIIVQEFFQKLSHTKLMQQMHTNWIAEEETIWRLCNGTVYNYWPLCLWGLKGCSFLGAGDRLPTTWWRQSAVFTRSVPIPPALQTHLWESVSIFPGKLYMFSWRLQKDTATSIYHFALFCCVRQGSGIKNILVTQ